eukprot:TRINITY_DN17327_c0_g1_i1.p1 TRINITY_DN17327_c0_g1~~TRINITY_DN17327_c0_g1_i1.p1  ORF type:complete len:256 (-),score=146.53 TRINITY_DN17327_c0_g1_i1:124-891(-)
MGRNPEIGTMAEEFEEGFQMSKAAIKKGKLKEKAAQKEAEDAAAAAQAEMEAKNNYAKPAAQQAAKPKAAAAQVNGGYHKPAGPPPSEEEKRVKALQKKLKQIQELEERQAKGDALNEDQLAKVAQKAELEKQLQSGGEQKQEEVAAVAEEPVEEKQRWGGYTQAEWDDWHAEQKKANESKVEEAPVAEPAPAPVVEEAKPEPEAEKLSAKALEKKLRQITELEQKKKAGETLNADQVEKIKRKKEFQAMLKEAK